MSAEEIADGPGKTVDFFRRPGSEGVYDVYADNVLVIDGLRDSDMDISDSML